VESPSPAARIGAEFLGTFWLVFGGCGAAVLAGVVLSPDKVPVGIGYLGVALAFGLTVLTMAFAIGHISGCHLNPAVSVGLWAGGRFPGKDIGPYIAAQVIGAIVAASAEYRDEFPHADRRRRSSDTGESTLEPTLAAQSAPMGWYAWVVNALRPLWLRVMAVAPAGKTVRGGLN